jgi:hypothetical protein
MHYANTDAQAMLDNDAKVAEEFDKKMRDGFGEKGGQSNISAKAAEKPER